MGVMEERLTLTESRVSGMIAAQRTAALQQQKSQHPDVSSSTTAVAGSVERTEVANTSAAPTASTSNDAKASAGSTVPGTADLRTIQLRVMCRQRGLDANGTEAELLKRLNDAVAATQFAQQQQSSSSSSSAAPTGTQREEGYLSQSSIHQSRHVANDSLEESAGSGDDDQDYDDEEEEEEGEDEEDYTGYAEEVEEEESYEEEAQFFEEKGVEEVGNYDSEGEEEEQDEGSDEEVDE